LSDILNMEHLDSVTDCTLFTVAMRGYLIFGE